MVDLHLPQRSSEEVQIPRGVVLRTSLLPYKRLKGSLHAEDDLANLIYIIDMSGLLYGKQNRNLFLTVVGEESTHREINHYAYCVQSACTVNNTSIKARRTIRGIHSPRGTEWRALVLTAASQSMRTSGLDRTQAQGPEECPPETVGSQ